MPPSPPPPPPSLSPCPHPFPGKILKVETKICAIWGILEANLKKSSTLKFMTNISFVSSIRNHRSIILKKKYACWLFSNGKYIFLWFLIFISARILVSTMNSRLWTCPEYLMGLICFDNSTCCHTEMEAIDQACYLTQSQYADTGPTSPSADPAMPGPWKGNHWSTNFVSSWYDQTR